MCNDAENSCLNSTRPDSGIAVEQLFELTAGYKTLFLIVYQIQGFQDDMMYY